MKYQIIGKDYRSIIKLEEVKKYLRVLHEEDDELIKKLIASAVDTAESFLSKNIFTKHVCCTIKNAKKEINLPIINGAQLLSCVIDNNPDIDVTGKVFITKTTLIINILFQKAKITYKAESIYQNENENYLPCDITLGILQHIESAYDKKPISILNILQAYKPYRKINI